MIPTASFTVCTLLCLQMAPPAAAFISNSQLAQEYAQLAQAHPTRARLYSLGQTVQGRDLTVIQISSNVTQARGCLVPMAKYVANMHGNEVVGRLLMLDLAKYLLQEYQAGNQRIVRLLDNTDIHILGTMNPDGYERTAGRVGCERPGRSNANGVDLNRNFPTWDHLSHTRAQLLSGRQPETQALMNWILDNPFVVSINFHDGAVVANFPYDDIDGNQHIYSATPDDTLVRQLAIDYANNHQNMHQSSSFPGGITNGADWYIVAGGMQDFNYLFSNSIELTVEVSQCKYPTSNPRTTQWNWNRESLLGYLESSHWGVKGLVTDRNGNVPSPGVRVMVRNNRKPVYTSACGEYWRLLLPGQYEVSAWGTDNYRSAWTPVSVPANAAGSAVRQDLVMDVFDADANAVWTPDLKPPARRRSVDITGGVEGEGEYNEEYLGNPFSSPFIQKESARAAPDLTCQCTRSPPPPPPPPVTTSAPGPDFICPPAAGETKVENEPVTLAAGHSLTLMSPNFGDKYPNGPYKCWYTIKHESTSGRLTLSLARADFSLQPHASCKRDFLRLLDIDTGDPAVTSEKLCGMLDADRTFRTTGRRARVLFKVNRRTAKAPGWRLVVSASP